MRLIPVSVQSRGMQLLKCLAKFVAVETAESVANNVQAAPRESVGLQFIKHSAQLADCK